MRAVSTVPNHAIADEVELDRIRATLPEGELPERLGDGWDDHRRVQAGYRAMVAFAGSIDRRFASTLVELWYYRDRLSEEEYRALLRRFPVPEDTAPDSWLFRLDEEPDATAARYRELPGVSVPDPYAGAPGLPWQAKCSRDQDVLMAVEAEDGLFVVAIRGRGSVYLNPIEARALGRALVKATGGTGTSLRGDEEDRMRPVVEAAEASVDRVRRLYGVLEPSIVVDETLALAAAVDVYRSSAPRDGQAAGNSSVASDATQDR